MSASSATPSPPPSGALTHPVAAQNSRAGHSRTAWLPATAVGVALVLVWWLASLGAEALPGPATTAAALADMASDGRLVSILWRLTAFMAVCFAIAVVLGVAGGLAIGMSRGGDRGLSPYLAALQGMPTSMWIPVAAIVLGTDVWSLGAVVALGAVPAIMLGTRTAVRNVPPLLLRAGRTLGESGTSLVRRVVLPAALPGIMTGVELGWSIAFRSLVAGEIFSGALSGTGIGTVISRSRETGDLTEMMATIVIVLAFTVVVDRLVFSRVQTRLRARRGLVDAGLPH
ncbi:ABC transporter permease subunit [Demequina sp. TTPB684]|uniref:ABC transporter permease n=1 Tax=unclassified Demequina TaxID=2620311 RepID=UPI001CF11C5C|nr:MULTISPECIES: ABC transporter permease subunit [unclassified Demequina]MCB2412983.1 ABC transporter permease subunit [Demequina sp. TTPB684]UPU89775.1 ABC transporter permease subunit [Demequina sp. TMPB413]